VAVGNLVGTSHKEVVYATSRLPGSDNEARVYLLNQDLETEDGWPFVVNAIGVRQSLGHPSSPALSDIDGDLFDEIVVAYTDIGYLAENMITIVDVDGSGQPQQYPNWPLAVSHPMLFTPRTLVESCPARPDPPGGKTSPPRARSG
jgi:hypothetical protein